MIIFIGLLVICSGVWAGGGKDNQNSPQWAGIYTGVIPSASGPGISVVAILYADATYKVTYHYIDRDPELFTFTGALRWDEKTKIITLDNKDLPPYYKVEKTGLVQLDREGKRITGPLAGNYKLRKLP